MPEIALDVPASLKAALEEEASRNGRDASPLATTALARYFDKPVHTVFQVATSGALVAGVYDREANVQTILQHRDFGLGTFANLDGEMVFIDGHAYQVPGLRSRVRGSAGRRCYPRRHHRPRLRQSGNPGILAYANRITPTDRSDSRLCDDISRHDDPKDPVCRRRALVLGG